MLRRANAQTKARGLLYVRLLTRYTPAHDQMVTGVSPVSSLCGGASRLRWRRRLELEIGHGVRGKRSRGSHGVGREAQQARGGPDGGTTAMAIRRPCAEKTVDGVVTVRLSSCASTWRSIGSSRSSWGWSWGEEGPVATVNDGGGDGRIRVCSGEGATGRGREQRVRGKREEVSRSL